MGSSLYPSLTTVRLKIVPKSDPIGLPKGKILTIDIESLNRLNILKIMKFDVKWRIGSTLRAIKKATHEIW